MRYKLIAILALMLIVACSPVCPPGTTLGPDGVCCEGEDGICDTDEVTEDLADQLEEPETEETEIEEETPEEQEEEVETTTEEETAPETEEAETEETETETPGPEPEETEETGDVSLQSYVSKYKENVNGYSFRLDGNEYKYKDGKLRLDLQNPAYLRSVEIGNESYQLFYYDVIYMDTAKDTAEGYCEGYDNDLRKQCLELEIAEVALPLQYSEYAVKLPHEYLLEWYEDKEILSKEEDKYHIQNREVTLVRATGGEMYLDPNTGLPLRVVVDGKTTEFDGLTASKVKDYDMYHSDYLETLNRT